MDDKRTLVAFLLIGAIFVLLPYYYEMMGIEQSQVEPEAVAEALANGCRVLSYDLHVFKKEFGDSIVRVPCYNLEIFAEKVIKYLECSKEENIEPQNIRTWEQASIEEFEIITNQFST